MDRLNSRIYWRKQMYQLRPSTKCISCLGCNLLDNEKFTGVLQCNNYAFDGLNHYKEQQQVKEDQNTIRKRIEKQKKQQWDKVIDQYWVGD